jgi:hypothetical protein
VSFAALFVLAAVLIADQKAKKHDVDQKAKIMVIMDWDGGSSDDIDLWLKTPQPSKIGYNSPNGRTAHLERDDLGKPFNFYVDSLGVKHYQAINREVISLREKQDGHYVVNAFFYARHADPVTNVTSTGPVSATVQLIEIDPAYRELGTQTVSMPDTQAEVTAFTFDIDDGEVDNIRTDVQESFVLSEIEDEQ